MRPASPCHLVTSQHSFAISVPLGPVAPPDCVNSAPSRKPRLRHSRSARSSTFHLPIFSLSPCPHTFPLSRDPAERWLCRMFHGVPPMPQSGTPHVYGRINKRGKTKRETLKIGFFSVSFCGILRLESFGRAPGFILPAANSPPSHILLAARSKWESRDSNPGFIHSHSKSSRSSRSFFRPDAFLFSIKSFLPIKKTCCLPYMPETLFFHASANETPEIDVRISILNGGLPS